MISPLEKIASASSSCKSNLGRWLVHRHVKPDKFVQTKMVRAPACPISSPTPRSKRVFCPVIHANAGQINAVSFVPFRGVSVDEGLYGARAGRWEFGVGWGGGFIHGLANAVPCKRKLFSVSEGCVCPLGGQSQKPRIPAGFLGIEEGVHGSRGRK